jgi:hypothetical protein
VVLDEVGSDSDCKSESTCGHGVGGTFKLARTLLESVDFFPLLLREKVIMDWVALDSDAVDLLLLFFRIVKG